jgi:hypothetical protein
MVFDSNKTNSLGFMGSSNVDVDKPPISLEASNVVEHVVDTLPPPRIEITKQPSVTDTQKIFEMYESIKKSDEPNEEKVEEDVSKIESLIFEHLELKKDEKQESNVQNQIAAESTQSLNAQQCEKLAQPDELLIRATSNLSIASTLTNSSQTKQSSTKSEDAEQPIPEWVCEGVCVIVTTNTVMNKRGHVRFIGETKFGTGKWIGVELEQSAGKNDGSVKGTRYFKCPENKGVFVRADKLSLVTADKAT